MAANNVAAGTDRYMLFGRAECAEIVEPERINGAEDRSDLALTGEGDDGGGFGNVR